MDRVELHYYLQKLTDCRNIYFQPPPTLNMKYPAVVYERTGIDNKYADNSIYNQKRSYSVTIIDSDPDSAIVDKVALDVNFKHDRHFVSDNLNHDVFTIKC